MGTEPVTISTLGHCVTRDIFGIADTDKRFKTYGNLGFISPISMFSDKPQYIEEILEKINKETNRSNFEKRCVLEDLNKTVFDYLNTNKGEWLLFSLAMFRYSILRKDKISVTSIRNNSFPIYGMVQNELISMGYSRITADKIPMEEILQCVDKLCDEILKIWKPEKIILLEDLPSNVLTKSNQITTSIWLSNYYDSNSYLYLLHTINKYAKEKLKCPVVHMPDMKYVTAYSEHKWGQNIYHYTDKVYRFIYTEICKIVFENEAEKYEAKKEQLSQEIKKEYYSALQKSTIPKTTIFSDDVLNCTAINNLPDYLDALAKLKNSLVLISIKDTAGFWLDKNIQSKLQKLGLIENLIKKLTVGYIAVIKRKMVLYESEPVNAPIQYCEQVDYYNIAIDSKPLSSGNLASISVNGIDYAVNSRGLNIVVVDLSTGKVADSVSFDTHIRNFPCFRRNDFHTNEDMIRIDLRRLQSKIDLMSKTTETLLKENESLKSALKEMQNN